MCIYIYIPAYHAEGFIICSDKRKTERANSLLKRRAKKFPSL